ncbi:hypothetical protein Pcac1_g17877 [Phytophthora cactorum]|nr:hypothetical protein Pcac1_g17877 [Phytophthora cactorum]KAG4040480.1 hypothetical protein PC123_g23980 [Phytophthora cactorum]
MAELVISRFELKYIVPTMKDSSMYMSTRSQKTPG